MKINGLLKYLFYTLFVFGQYNVMGQTKQIPNVPQHYFTDISGLIAEEEGDSINEILAQLEKVSSNQFLIYVDTSLQHENLEEYVHKVFNTWKLGRKDKDNGILLMIFMKERSFRLEVGYGLESRLPDGLCKKIQEEYLIPYFKDGTYGKGILEYAKQIADFSSAYAMGFGQTNLTLKLFNERLYDPDQQVTNYDDYYFDYYIDDTPNYWYPSEVYFFFMVTTNKLNTPIETLAKERREQLAQIFPDLDRMVVIVHDKRNDKYFYKADELVQNDFTSNFKIENIVRHSNSKVSELLIQEDTKELFANISSQILTNLEFKVFIGIYPIYTSLMRPFFETKDIMFNQEYCWFMFIQILGNGLFLIINLLLISFIKFPSARHRNVSYFWVLLNLLFPIIGFIFQMIYSYKIIRTIRFQNNNKEKFATRMEYIDDTGYPGWWAHIEGNGGGYTGGGGNYRSSSSSSSSSRSSSSSSGSSSSRSSFGGGGGGRSGGGGSSGKW